MKHRKKDLDIDTIGGLGALTKEDEKAISAFIKARKAKAGKKKTRTSTSGKKAA